MDVKVVSQSIVGAQKGAWCREDLSRTRRRPDRKLDNSLKQMGHGLGH